MSYRPSPAQIKKIKTLARQVFGDDDAAYREMLRGQAQVKSCTALRGPQIDLVIRHLELCAGQRPVPQGQGQSRGAQAGKPTPTMSQKDYIRYLWDRVSYAPGGLPREQALRRFIQARFQISDVEFLDQQTGIKVIEALKEMRKRGQGPGVRGQKKGAQAGKPAPLEG